MSIPQALTSQIIVAYFEQNLDSDYHHHFQRQRHQHILLSDYVVIITFDMQINVHYYLPKSLLLKISI